MTNDELLNILDNINKKQQITKDELIKILYELEHDISDEIYHNKKLDVLEKQYYMGESNALHIALLLIVHLKE